MATAKKTPVSKKSGSKRLKDPKGGLTEAGRKHFAKSEGANLKPGVKSVKSPEDMRRKGSFLRRHYGRKTPSPLVDDQGKPTRYALQARAWGEPVPKTKAAVSKLAAKGAKLLEQYHSASKKSAKSTKRKSAS